MPPGDVYAVETGDVPDVHYVDTGMYDTPEYGSVYLIDAERPALVDTGIGADRDRVLAALDAVGIDRADLAVMAVTHVHLDHAGGAGYLAAECPNATVAVHERGARHLGDPDRLWAGTKEAVGDQIDFYAEPEPVPEGRIRELSDGDRIDLGDRDLRAHAAPGHAPHQVVFEYPAGDAVFTADAAGIYVPARDAVRPTTPPPQFDFDRALADLDTLRDMDPETLCYAHFGAVPAAGRLSEYEHVLEEWVAEVRARRAELDDEGVVEHFVATNRMEDVWGERKARSETAMNVRGVLSYLDRAD